MELIFSLQSRKGSFGLRLIQTPSLAKAPGSQSALSGSSKVAAGTVLGLLGASECMACLEDHFRAAPERMSSLSHIDKVGVVDLCDS